MDRWLDIVIYIALAAVAVTLAFGIYSLYRGGDFARSYSNRLMRLRVVMQFIAVVILVLVFWWRTRGG